MRNNHRRDEKNGAKHARGSSLFVRFGLLCVLNVGLLCHGLAQRPSGRQAAKPDQSKTAHNLERCSDRR